ncbi:hexose transporter [Colletotrichum sublineola]|nr:hexose transporter [Colletotrichum sublineola]
MRDEQIVGAALAEVLPQTDKYWFQQPHLLRLNVLLLVPLLSSSVAGYDGSLMNGLQSLQQWREYFGHPTGVKLGVVNAAQSIDSVLALPIIGYLADRLGRKPVLLSAIILIIIATIIQSTSINLPMFIISRLVVGFGGMFVVHPSLMLIAELAYPTHRGKYTLAFWTMYYLIMSSNRSLCAFGHCLTRPGAILASWTTFGCQDYQSEWVWRIPSILQAGFPLVQLCFFAWVPESPRWLIARERTKEAAAILARYHSGVQDPAEGRTPLVRREVAEIVQTIHQEKTAVTTGWMALVATPGNRKRTLIAVCVGAFAQWNGIGVVSYYLTLVLNTVGITDTFTQTLINGLLQIFNFGAALSAAFLVDRLGRRTLFLWSGAGMLASYIVWTACSAVNTETGSKPAGIVVVVCLFTFYFHYDIAYTPLLLGYPTEIFPYSLRSKGIAVELFAIYGSLIIAAFVNPIGLENIGWRYYIVFCCLLAVFFAVTWYLFPETKGHSLEEIAVIFDGPQAVEDFEGSSDSKEEKILAKGGLHDVVHKERA